MLKNKKTLIEVGFEKKFAALFDDGVIATSKEAAISHSQKNNKITMYYENGIVVRVENGKHTII